MPPTKTTKSATSTGDRAPRKRAAAAGGKPLVIVESPAKAKTIAGYLGNDYVVEASIGHIRDLPRHAAVVPAAHKGSPGRAWASTWTTASSRCTWSAPTAGSR